MFKKRLKILENISGGHLWGESKPLYVDIM
jgi:hypothetical protein